MTETDLPHHYKSETAGHLALRRVPVVPATESVGGVRGLLRSGNFETVDLMLLTDPSAATSRRWSYDGSSNATTQRR